MKSSSATITRSIQLERQKLDYKLRYSNRAKYLRLQISSGNELELVLPKGYELKEAENFLLKKADWINKHLRTAVKKEPQFLLFGSEIKVTQEYELLVKKHKIIYKRNEIKIVSPAGSKIKTTALYESWLKHQAKIYIPKRVKELAAEHKFYPRKISIRGQKTRWGSCSAKGNLNFNFKLMRYKKEIIDYVIIHELCHLKQMNHSPKFWELGSKFLPGL